MKLYPKGPPRSEPTSPKPPPSKEDLAARKARQAEEGVLAMAEYQQQQKEMLERTARLRAERLARDAEPVASKAKPVASSKAKPAVSKAKPVARKAKVRSKTDDADDRQSPG